MIVGLFTWQPELKDARVPSSAGGAIVHRFLIDEFIKAGHKVGWLSDLEAPEGTTLFAVEDCDVSIFCWRWEMPKYPERHALYERQRSLINRALAAGKRVIVHDQDHYVSSRDHKTLSMQGVQFFEPSLNPRPGYQILHYPNPFKQVFDIRNRSPFMTPDQMIYIGNVYERLAQARQYLNVHRLRLKVFGNWLEPGDGRPGPEQMKVFFPDVKFAGRIPQRSVLENLVSADFTIHLFKPSYGTTGFMANRWAEAVAVSTPAFIPYEFYLPEEIKTKWNDLGLIVRDAEELEERYFNTTEARWKSMVMAQREFINNTMRIEPWLELIEKEAV